MNQGPGTRVAWDGSGYHRVATVQERWGIQMLEEIPPGRYRRIVEAGCGSGRMAVQLLKRYPDARVLGIDLSQDMLRQAARTLARYRRRAELMQGDLCRFRLSEPADLIFSNATFHWVSDHGLLFRNLYRALQPGGWLVAQCGGRGNLRRTHRLANEMTRSAGFRRYFAGWRKPSFFSGAGPARRRLREAGFEEIRGWLAKAPTTFDTVGDFREFARNVFLRSYLTRLPEGTAREDFLYDYVERFRRRFGEPCTLDYVRLNLVARRAKK